jgi:hypothetical protein
MRIYVDFSVFTDSEAVGNVHGYLDLGALPRKGELVSFDRPQMGIAPIQVAGFPYQLAVEQVVHTAGDRQGSLSLTDVVVGSREDAKSLFAYLEHGFGLYADEYEGKQ